MIATVQLLKEARSFTAADTRFWVVRPRAEATGVSGLSTLLLGRLHRRRRRRLDGDGERLQGLEVPPIVTRDDSGRQFVLRADDLGSLDIGSPVYYRRIKVGQVAAYELDEDGKGVTLRVFINSPYEKFVGANTRFWHASGFDMQIDASGFRLRTQSLATVVLGGIAFQAPDDKPGPPAPENTAFGLAPDEGAALAPDDGPSRDGADVLQPVAARTGAGRAGGFPRRGARRGQVDRRRVRSARSGNSACRCWCRSIPNACAAAPVIDAMRTAQSAPGPAATDDRARPACAAAPGQPADRPALRGAGFLPECRSGRVPGAPPNRCEVPTVPNSLDELQSQIGEIALKLNKMPYEQIGNDLRQTHGRPQPHPRHGRATGEDAEQRRVAADNRRDEGRAPDFGFRRQDARDGEQDDDRRWARDRRRRAAATGLASDAAGSSAARRRLCASSPTTSNSIRNRCCGASPGIRDEMHPFATVRHGDCTGAGRLRAAARCATTPWPRLHPNRSQPWQGRPRPRTGIDPALHFEVAPVGVPERLARPQMVIRNEKRNDKDGVSPRVDVLEQQRWSSSFDSELRDAFAGAIASRARRRRRDTGRAVAGPARLPGCHPVAVLRGDPGQASGRRLRLDDHPLGRQPPRHLPDVGVATRRQRDGRTGLRAVQQAVALAAQRIADQILQLQAHGSVVCETGEGKS